MFDETPLIDGAGSEPEEEPRDEETLEENSDEAEMMPESDEVAHEDRSRRDFMTQILAGSIGAIVGLVPFVAGLVFFLDPLFREKRAVDEEGTGSQSGVAKDSQGYIKLPVTRSALPIGGSPQLVTIKDDLVDAWNKFPNVPIGTVWLRRLASGEVIAFNTICPHLGCSVEYRGSQQDFYCPCHLSAFKLDGQKNNPIPPRDMDRLEIKADTGDEIWVQFRNFRGGISEKVAT
ncbi:MAG: Rieske 2Fe-2S domain-containing protein [Planctomycetaceae bacterium]|nr:Rieske 2Fe-2S domain-containing protein [Planctomycetaceae bacterium]